MKYDIPLEYFQSRLLYGRHSGDLIWKDGQCKNQQVGCIVENEAGNQYRFMSIGYEGKTYNFMVHQVIWFLCVEQWAEELDHIDGDGLFNRLVNLRPVTRSVNNMNHRRQRNNTSGLSGVSWTERLRKFRAYGMNGARKQVSLGCHVSLFEAACARKRWELELNFTERHGK